MYQISAYIKIDGQRNFKDSEIMSLYDRMAEEGTVNTVFQDGLVTCREDFLREMKTVNRLHIVFDGKEPVAVVWLNRFEGRTARLHFCFFKKIWGVKSVEIGRFICSELLNYQYENEFIYDALIGRIPASNTLAIRFFEKVGVKFVGELPEGHWNDRTKKSEPCFVVYINRRAL